MKIAIITDTHFGARNDSRYFDDYFKKFYDEIFFPYMDEHEIKTVFHLGDVFDRRKYINFSTLKSCKTYFFDQLRDRGIDVTVIPGNHDTYYKNTNEINSTDLLLKEYSNIDVIQTACNRTIDNKTYTFIPWLCEANYDSVMQQLQTASDMCFGHFEIAGFDMFRGMKNDGGMDRKILAHYPKVLTGHFHHRSTDDNIYYLGSPYGFTWSDYDDARGFHILNTRTDDVTFIENPNMIFHKIYYDDRNKEKIDVTQYRRGCVKVIVVNKTDYPKFDKFIDSLYMQDVIELTIHEDFSEFESGAIDSEHVNIEDTMTLLSEFVDSTESAKDKERLKTLLKTLYVEAQNLQS